MFHELGLVDLFTVITVYGMHTIINNFQNHNVVPMWICWQVWSGSFFSLLDKYCQNIYRRWKYHICLKWNLYQIVDWKTAMMWITFGRPMAKESCIWPVGNLPLLISVFVSFLFHFNSIKRSRWDQRPNLQERSVPDRQTIEKYYRKTDILYKIYNSEFKVLSRQE